MAALAPESVKALYLGYELTITDRRNGVTVSTPDGRTLGQAASIGGARRLIRGYRKPLGRSTT